MDFSARHGMTETGEPVSARQRRLQTRMALLASGLPVHRSRGDDFQAQLTASFRQKARLLAEHRCPVDTRIESFLRRYLGEKVGEWWVSLPDAGIVLSCHGIARELSLPRDGYEYKSDLLSSYRVRNGVLHNPKADRRTTEGTFHVAEGGLPVPGSKRSVPKPVFAELLRRAVCAQPANAMGLPYYGSDSESHGTWVSLLLRPTVCPEVAGVTPRKSLEVRFFAPGSLVSNLDFVESVFGNAGDPFLPGNDAALDVEHWTGHTGCVILAPHLVDCTKKELGLPHVSKATDRQKRDRMCWDKEDEKYNDGVAFKVTCRDHAGVIVTVIADNYYGYCKKEVKTQISYAANLFGGVEEEHAGGAVAFASFGLGDEFVPDQRHSNGRTFADVLRDYGDSLEVLPEGHAVDRVNPDLFYVPETTRFSVKRQELWWTRDGREQSVIMRPDKVYMLPSGFRVRLEKHSGAPSYRIVGTAAEGVFCHKPCTVSGGGKSEISKSIRDYKLYGPIFVNDPTADIDLVKHIIEKDYSVRWKPDAPDKPDYAKRPTRRILDAARSLGSVIKLLTPSDQNTDDFNAFLRGIPDHIFALVFIIKRFYRPEWNGDWLSHFSVDVVNGVPGHELKFNNRKLVGTYLRVGFTDTGNWRTFKLRQDFIAAAKIQTEDDISASVVVPGDALGSLGTGRRTDISSKFVVNCEYRLFQRPDDAVHRGLDRQTERDLSGQANFLSNFEPIPIADVRRIVEKVTEFDSYTTPVKHFLRRAVQTDGGYVVVSSQPRIVDGKPSKNPRYLQTRPDLRDPLGVRSAEQAMRLVRALPADAPVHLPVDAVLLGRRNNPPDKSANIRALAVYSPIHYQELPELFMDFISSLTGRSPSTTGAGSEGALTKGPFNAVRTTADLNTALVSYILTGLAGFSSAAGCVGPKFRCDHDISLLIPEIWCRLSPQERDPAFLIQHGYLEKIPDLTLAGRPVPSSRLGYRITASFCRVFFGRVFDNPTKIFDDTILRPESQDPEAFADGMANIMEAHQRVAREYIEDGSIEEASPPLRALIEIMANGRTASGMDINSPDLRSMFTRASLLSSEWYRKRLATKQRRDVTLWKRHVASAEAAALPDRAAYARGQLRRVSAPSYLNELIGTLGADPMGEL
jgi:phosphoenolpyruvate carboxykinase (diphosphate)